MSDHNDNTGGIDITALRSHLFEALRAVRAGTLDLDKARAINDLGKTIIDTGKLEVDHIRATGDVLVDQLVQMQRTGFSSAVLREGVDAADAQRQFDRFPAFYQGDAVNPQPHFVNDKAAV